MIERKIISNAVGKIAWGYIFIHLNFNLGSINLLPDWIGYFLIVSSLNTVGGVEKSALLLKTPGYCAAAWCAVLWMINIFGLAPDSFIYNMVDMILSIVMLYFHFQLLTNLAEVAEKYMCPHKPKLLVLRNMRTVLITFLYLPLPFEESPWLMYAALAVSMVVMVWTCACLFSLKKSTLIFVKP